MNYSVGFLAQLAALKYNNSQIKNKNHTRTHIIVSWFGKLLQSFDLLIEMSTTTCNVRGKPSDGGIMQKVGPMKATIPMSSLLRPLNGSNNSSSIAGNGRTASANLNFYSAMSPPMRLISPDHNSSGHRSPGAANYFKGSNCGEKNVEVVSSKNYVFSFI